MFTMGQVFFWGSVYLLVFNLGLFLLKVYRTPMILKSELDWIKLSGLLFIFSTLAYLSYPFIPAMPWDYYKVESYLEQAKKDQNQDLIIAIENVQQANQMTVGDRIRIEKLREKGI